MQIDRVNSFQEQEINASDNSVVFDERSYVNDGREPGDPYRKNAFNVKVSDELPSDREIADTRDEK